jgi:methylenetetrahydrofolate dehydrogenase (NADP+) / methenyltetrahydrofolate cyclohydrolase
MEPIGVTATLLDGKALAETIQRETAAEVDAHLAATGVRPCLAAVLVGSDAASEVYVRNKRRDCEKAGIDSQLHRYDDSLSESELLALVARLNADQGVHGILVQLPLPKQINTARVLEAVSPLKDVDAFHPENVGLIVQGQPRFFPCTPFGVVQLLQRNNVSTAGAHAVVLGRSDIVGKPLANMLIQRGIDATVTVCHSRTRDLPSITRQADILIAAIGQARFVTPEMVKPGAVVIDVGINRTEQGLVGDVDFGPVSEVAAKITPVPGGVGPLTRAMLLRNTLAAAKLRQ